MRRTRATIIGIGLLSISPLAFSEGWNFGIGTGVSSLDVSGDGGFNTALLGPVDFDASLEPDEVVDYMESALGLAGFAKKGDITITYSIGRLELQEDVAASYGAVNGEIDLTFESIGAEVLVDYAVIKSGDLSVGVIGGFRYSEQEYDVKLSVAGAKVFEGSVEDDWVDAVIGASLSYAISPTLSWSAQVDAGFGDSESTSHFNTSIGKVLGTSWLLSGSIDFKAVEYEEGDRGDSEWYLYDADETTIGIGVLYLF